MEKKNIHKPKTIQTHFKDYCIDKTQKGHNKDIYNFDKTRF